MSAHPSRPRSFWGVTLLIGLNLLASVLVLWMGWTLRERMDALALLSLHAQAELYKQQIRQCLGGGGRWSDGRSLEECALGVLAQEGTLLDGLEVRDAGGGVVFSHHSDAVPDDPDLRVSLPMKMPRAVEYQVRFRFRPEAAGEWRRAGQRHFFLSLMVFGLLAVLSIAIGVLHRRNLVLQEGLLRAGHLSEMGLMTAGLAHELRNPLASIRGLSQVMGESGSGGEREHLDTIVRETGRMERLVEDLLLFARQRDPVRERVPVGPLLESAVGELNLGERVKMEIAGGAHARGDADQLRQVFLNLLRNAAEAPGGGGEINVTASMRRGSVAIVVRNPAPDLGPGDLERFFTPFHTTKSRGTGLGLFLSRRLVERHGGTLRASLDAGRLTLEAVLPRG